VVKVVFYFLACFEELYLWSPIEDENHLESLPPEHSPPLNRRPTGPERSLLSALKNSASCLPSIVSRAS